MIAPVLPNEPRERTETVAVATAAPAKLLLSAKAAAEALSISQRKLWSLTTGGEIAHVRIGRRVCYAPADLEAFIARQREGG